MSQLTYPSDEYVDRPHVEDKRKIIMYSYL